MTEVILIWLQPFSSKFSKVRSLRNENKLYIKDQSGCTDETVECKNMVTSYLLKLCNLWEDSMGEDISLQFLRNTQAKKSNWLFFGRLKLGLQLSLKK
jgi:hypothetical protein